MNNTWLILKREYITRVRKKSFIVLTLLVPFLFIGFIALEIYLAAGAAPQQLQIAVLDKSHLFDSLWKDDTHFHFQVLQQPLPNDSLSSYPATHGADGLLYIPDTLNILRPAGIRYFSQKKLPLESYVVLKSKLENALEHLRLSQLHVNMQMIDSVKNSIQVNIEQPLTRASELQAGVSIAIAMICGFLIYFILIFFGVSVMRGVMEEKVNRIAEVIVSSVKPFQLMLGKIMGIAAVGLTQFLIWIILILVLWGLLHPLLPDLHAQVQNMQPADVSANEQMQMLQSVSAELLKLPLLEIVICFILYFLGGYFLYASLFAAIGSVVDQDASDAQQLTFPITLPIVISFLIALRVARDPDSALAVFTSLFPFSSPLVMVARLPYGVPWWQLALSLLLLAITFLFTTWLAAKIYRTGILLYGKKVTLKEIARWLCRKK
ncbi:ABC transporter permease [Thermoflavifilum thermophilum]|uniref:ABC-2 type transport system permease protein n=1 Tax=Thermoflavifilum thermophilum TaxID=1393122 RepID=A0A1I7N7D0_9BACT|nr:ABC transporter permease [Thermoflavifilum thermophilum]SFV30476.1 ABC-2 type transport system permease protein [Thermoflavifilum thermophilum]